MNPVIEVLQGQLSQYSIILDDLQEAINHREHTLLTLREEYETYLNKYDAIQQHIEELQNATK